MIRAVLDTNIFVQALISPPRSASVRTVASLYDVRFRLIYSAATMDELLHVLLLPEMRHKHKLSSLQIAHFLKSLERHGTQVEADDDVSPAVTRDITDTKFLALAAAARADCLVTNDRRHLLPLQRFGETDIITPVEFLDRLEGQG